MVDPQNSPPARTRPSVVTVSSYLIILFVVTQVINLLLSFTTISATREAFRSAYQGADPQGADTLAGVGVAFAIAASVFTVLLAVGLLVLALLNNRGKNWSRITTWVVGGLLVCCTGGGLISGAAGVTGSQGSSPDLDTEELQRRLEAELPSWYNGLTLTLNVIGLLALLAALILLALPAANEFFRKPQAGPGGGYPQGQPGYPPTPGYPQHPGEPGYPQAPGAPGYPPTPGAPGYPQYPGQSTPPPGQPPASGDQGPSDRPS
ncbi:hypothetical protein E1091_05445 [Micromonospora fluostatini]|uniref:Uncharacterized protein n=1 Tax=Micromonospora fluostatini TaxID=1629071 RepID=A0ABY2DJB7_9ACTN|nr:hypothetical protein E1091_05445 [Micromonospora fluostatini]